MSAPPAAPPSRRQIRRWRQYLADERAEAAVYSTLAARKEGAEQQILTTLADAEGRHESHWLELLGPAAEPAPRTSLRTRVMLFLAAHFGTVFVLALMQRAEGRTPYDDDADATDQMAADERIHGEVLRGLAARGREQLSGSFRAAVFGANDGLVSNLALVLGIGATGVSNQTVLFTGVAGLLAGALSMGAGEYVSVRSQRELLQSTRPDPEAQSALPHLDLDANELALVYRARGMEPADAQRHASEVLATQVLDADSPRGGRGRSARSRRQRLVRGAVELLLLRLRCVDPGAAVPVRRHRGHRHRHRLDARRSGPARHRRGGRDPVRRLAAATGAAPAGDRVRRRRRHLPARTGLRRDDGLNPRPQPPFGSGRRIT